jgi:phage-related protein
MDNSAKTSTQNQSQDQSQNQDFLENSAQSIIKKTSLETESNLQSNIGKMEVQKSIVKGGFENFSDNFDKTEKTNSVNDFEGKTEGKNNTIKSYSYTKQSKKQKQLILACSLFLLGQDGTKKTYWTILTASIRGKVLKLGVTAQKNKYGTTLTLLRKYAKSLSEYLNHGRYLNFYPKVVFFINKEAEEINELYSLLDSIEASTAVER